MWSKRLMWTVVVGMAVLVLSTSVAAQECQRPPAKIATLMITGSGSPFVYLLCDKAKAPACGVTFWCTGRSNIRSSVPDEDPVTWDVSVEPGSMFFYSSTSAASPVRRRSLVEAMINAGWTQNYSTSRSKACVVRSNDPVEVIASQLSGGTFRTMSYRISPPEPYPCPSSNAALSSLTVSGGGTLSPSFDSDTTEYTFTTRATTVAFTPTAADSGATIRVNNAAVQSGTASGSFSVPWRRLPITVTAEDGTTTRTYYVSTARFGP